MSFTRSEKFPGLEAWWKNKYGNGFDALTEAELRSLKKFKTADRIRDRIAEEGHERSGGLDAELLGEEIPDYERADLALARRQEELKRRAAERRMREGPQHSSQAAAMHASPLPGAPPSP